MQQRGKWATWPYKRLLPNTVTVKAQMEDCTALNKEWGICVCVCVCKVYVSKSGRQTLGLRYLLTVILWVSIITKVYLYLPAQYLVGLFSQQLNPETMRQISLLLVRRFRFTSCLVDVQFCQVFNFKQKQLADPDSMNTQSRKEGKRGGAGSMN